MATRFDVERRVYPKGVTEVRLLGDAPEARGIEGYAAVIGPVADLGAFTEEIAPGAFDGANLDDVRALFNHNPDYILGRTKSGTLQIFVEDSGLRYAIPELPRSRQDVLEAIARGDVDGNSFSFTVAEDKWARRDGRDHRIITRIAEVYDVSPVTFPAYPDTAVALRSRDAWLADGAKELRSVPRDVSRELAPRDEAWEVPILKDFTDTPWEDLSYAEKRRIAGHYAWSDSGVPPDRFGDLKLPHHRPSDGRVVWRGVVAAAQRLGMTDIPEADKDAVRAHLASHYRQFGEEPPWERSAREHEIAEQYRERFRRLGAKV